MLSFLAAVPYGIGGAVAHAHSGPPAALRLFVPAERPEVFVLVTSFGIVTSQDTGSTWAWACDHSLSSTAFGHRMGPGRTPRFFAVSYRGAIFSDDFGCSWSASTVSIPGARVLEVAPNPNDAKHVLALVATLSGTGQENAVVASNDGGKSFERVLYRTSYPTLLSSIAVVDAQNLYVTGRREAEPWLARSHDGGNTWRATDLAAHVGASEVRVLGVSAEATLYLHVLSHPDEALAISDDGGQSVQIAKRVEQGTLRSFMRRPSGALVLAGVSNGISIAWTSSDGGASWSAWSAPPHVRDFAERGGSVYVVGDATRDGFAVAASAAVADEAMLHPFVRFSDITATRQCAATVCNEACAFEVDRKNLSHEVCELFQSDLTVDAGAQDAAAPAKDASGDDGAWSSAPDAGIAGDTGSYAADAGQGCSCAVTKSRDPSGRWLWLLAAAWVAAGARNRVPRRRARGRK